MAANAPALARQAAATARHAVLLTKVAGLLVIELGVFPAGCGWWLDACTPRLFGTTLSGRVAFAMGAPITATVVHWSVGLLYMLGVSIFVSLLREVLRPGALAFLKDPADPAFNPFRDLVEEPLSRHVRRIVLSASIYGAETSEAATGLYRGLAGGRSLTSSPVAFLLFLTMSR